MMMTTTKPQTIQTLGLTSLGLLTLLLPLAAQKPGKKATESGDRAAQEYREALEAQTLARAQEIQEVRKQDSLRCLIHELDTGPSSGRNSAASKAYQSLRSLGPLMVSALVAELDDMGPFGLMNASKLLGFYPDESLGALVERYLKDPSPARQEMAAGLLGSLGSGTRRKLYPLALASKRDKVRLAGIYAMTGLGIEEDEILKEIELVYKEGRGPTKSALISVIGAQELEKNARGRDFLRRAMKDPDSNVRAAAFMVFLKTMEDEDEDQVLALLHTLGAGDRGNFLAQVLKRDTRWPRVLMVALAYPDLRSRVRMKLDDLAIRLSPEQISSLFRSKDMGLLRFALQRLQARKALVPKMEPLLGLMEHPDYQIRTQAMMLLVESGDQLLLESRRFEDLSRLGRPISDLVRILERASGGHWIQEMFEVWRQAEQYEITHSGNSMADVKERIAQLMVRNLGLADWPLLQDFLLGASGDPQVDQGPRDTYWNRHGLLLTLIEAGYLDRELQIKALHLTPHTTGRIAEEIFNRVSEDLVPGQSRPELESVLFELIAKPAETQQASRRHAWSRGSIVGFCFQLLRGLPSSKRDAELLAFVKSSEGEVASAASAALLARSKERTPIYEAMLASPHASALIAGVLDRPELARVSQLRKATIGLLQADMLFQLHMKYKPAGEKLEAFLHNLGREERTRVLTGLLTKLPQGLDDRLTSLLIERLGDNKDERHLTVFAPYMEDRSHRVRLAAVEAIGKTFSPKAAPYLLEAFKDDRTIQMARAYLRKIDEYLQEKAKWEKRFSGRKPLTPRPGLPSVPSRTKK